MVVRRPRGTLTRRNRHCVTAVANHAFYPRRCTRVCTFVKQAARLADHPQYFRTVDRQLAALRRDKPAGKGSQRDVDGYPDRDLACVGRARFYYSAAACRSGHGSAFHTLPTRATTRVATSRTSQAIR